MKARKIIIPISILAGCAVIGIAIFSLTKSANAVSYSETSILEQKNLQNSISLSGIVESTNLNQVYANLTYQIEAVNVQVGDVVKKGDILCTLNTSELQNQILQQQATIDSNNISTQYQLTDAEKNYQEALAKYNNGTNSQIVSAEQSVENAKLALDKAQLDYDNAVNGKNLDSDTQIKSAEVALKNAEENLAYYQQNYNSVKKEVDGEDYYSIKDTKKAYDDAVKAKDAYIGFLAYDNELLINYNDTKKAYEKAKESIDLTNKAKIDSALQSLTSAKQSVENAKVSLENAKKSADSSDKSKEDTILNYKSQLTNAQVAYENAKNNYNLTVKDNEANLSSLKATAERERTLSTSNNSQLILLESYKAKLEDAVIKAPCDGTITSVGAVIGSMPNGALFTIEDIDNLKINASVSEFDIPLIKLGMPVTIKSDAMKNVSYEGIISKIAPTAKKSNDGTNSGTASFNVEVSVVSNNTDLLIGMTAKLSIVTEEKENVFAVLYDAVATDENGDDIIYTVEKTETGNIAKAVPVTVGMETDFEVEISGDGLSKGMLILTETDELSDNSPINLDEDSTK